jgi:hypothetical protein
MPPCQRSETAFPWIFFNPATTILRRQKRPEKAQKTLQHNICAQHVGLKPLHLKLLEKEKRQEAVEATLLYITAHDFTFIEVN